MRKNLFATVLVLLCFIQLNAQERVYVPYFEVMNIHPDYQYSTSKLFKTYVDNYNKYELILPDKYDTLGFDESFEQAKQRASKLNCKYFIQGELNRLGDVVIVTIKMYNTSDGNKFWQSILKANTPDDIDPIMEKIAYNLGNQNQMEDNNIYNVTDYDSRELNKIGANRYFGVSIGDGYTFVNDINKNFPAGFGLMWSYDMRDIIFNLRAETYFSDAKVYYFDIDAIYPFNSLKNSPFVLGGMGYGGINLKRKATETSGYNYYTSDSDGGLILFAGGGYLLNRNSDVALRFSGNFYFPLFDVGKTNMPVGFLFTTTILFGR
jgi:TolB-like protein